MGIASTLLRFVWTSSQTSPCHPGTVGFPIVKIYIMGFPIYWKVVFTRDLCLIKGDWHLQGFAVIYLSRREIFRLQPEMRLLFPPHLPLRPSSGVAYSYEDWEGRLQKWLNQKELYIRILMPKAVIYIYRVCISNYTPLKLWDVITDRRFSGLYLFAEAILNAFYWWSILFW